MSKFLKNKRTKADPNFKTHAIDNLKTSTIDEQLMLNIEAKYVILFEGSIPHILIWTINFIRHILIEKLLK